MAEQVAYNIDCMEYMRTLPDNFFDLAVVDPLEQKTKAIFIQQKSLCRCMPGYIKNTPNPATKFSTLTWGAAAAVLRHTIPGSTLWAPRLTLNTFGCRKNAGRRIRRRYACGNVSTMDTW